MIRTQLSLFKLQKEKALIEDIEYIDVSKIKMINSSSGSKNIITKTYLKVNIFYIKLVEKISGDLI
jgi:hypothetical protein